MSEDPFKTDFSFGCADLDSADLLEPEGGTLLIWFALSGHLSALVSLPSFHSFRSLSERTLKALKKKSSLSWPFGPHWRLERDLRHFAKKETLLHVSCACAQHASKGELF